MKNYHLTSRSQAEVVIAQAYATSKAFIIEVQEDKAFEGRWLPFGSVELDAGAGVVDYRKAIQRGSFEWRTPDRQTFAAKLGECLAIGSADQEDKVRRLYDAIAGIIVRSGLCFPQFDPAAVELMPFRKSVSILSDTNAVLQGGLDFVACYLTPAARIKIPAIVQMEIVNFCDRFLSLRRKKTNQKANLLLEHLNSQGGQRVLLRMELNTETEIERDLLFGDPIRVAFQKDSSITDLNLTVPVRAYADRLILEAVRQHQSQSHPSHGIFLMTSDQGLARMAIAEGVSPLFFKAVDANLMFDRVFTGVRLHPFSGKIQENSLTSLLWEFAVSFGSARLRAADREEASFTVTAFGDGLNWFPYHSRDDLLWCMWPESNVCAPTPSRGVGVKTESRSNSNADDHDSVSIADKENSDNAGTRFPGFPRVNVQKIIELILALASQQVIETEGIQKFLNIKNPRSLAEYRRFLSPALATIEPQAWRATDLTQSVACSLTSEDAAILREAFKNVPACADLVSSLECLKSGNPLAIDESDRSFQATRVLGEIMGVCARIPEKGLLPTLRTPDAETFAAIAIRTFVLRAGGHKYIATGEWLEALIEIEGIHPEVARRLLEEASEKGYLKRFAEGSTTDTRFDEHTVHVLRVRQNKPKIETVHLYRGDYLLEHKSSSSIRITGADQ